ncbi:hypothetical protein AWB75_01963 [Caballeronia catudaia]|uniref:Uncharacterized protein n=1 Tax=Caballeronia catudaia TaxID=1777136 RepID=A0A158ABF5_9BURK|nr:hypothetical protein [Caballeronia catudaia]SAK55035.1 hypothetical protein AWB75_01963 [Caballeronia catudaia]
MNDSVSMALQGQAMAAERFRSKRATVTEFVRRHHTKLDNSWTTAHVQSNGVNRANV